MAHIIFEADATEFDVIPKEWNTTNAFCINEHSMVISFCDKNDKVVAQSEISIDNARKLAQLINI